MNRSLFVGATALGTCLGICAMLAVSVPAWAYVIVSPEKVTAGDYETLTVSVPTEKDIPTTEIRVEVPEGFLLSGVQPVPGWEHAFEEDGGVVTAVTFSGGEIRPREFQQFLLQAQAPEEPGKYPWKAFQTYEDGSVVEWTAPRFRGARLCDRGGLRPFRGSRVQPAVAGGKRLPEGSKW